MKTLTALFLVLGYPLFAQTMFAEKGCPDTAEVRVLQTFQYWLTAETALRGTALWTKENPDAWRVWYESALTPERQSNDPLAEAARAAFLGRSGDERVRAVLLNAKWDGAVGAAEQPWRDFLIKTDPEMRLAALAKVDFNELHILKAEKLPINPWIYRVLSHETAAMLKQLTRDFGEGHPFHGTARLLAVVTGAADKAPLVAMLKAKAVPKLLDANDGMKDKTLKLWEMDAVPHDQTRAFFTILDSAGFRYRLLRGEYPRPDRPRGLRGDALVDWREQEAEPFLTEFRFWEEQMVLRLFQMGDHAAVQRLLSNRHELKRAECAYQAAISFALLRYGADILNPKGHYRERNFLKEQGFNGYQMLFQLEIEPTHGSSTF